MIAGLLLAGAMFAVPGSANVVLASGAGSLPATAQDLSGDTSLNGIVGTLAFPDGVDMFKINILYPLEFAAYTINTGALGVPDPELFLFDANGLGVLANDDTTPANTQSCLPASSSQVNPCPSSRGGLGPLTSGIYYLAITRAENSPLSNSGYIFSPVLSTDVVGPDLTMGGAAPITGWDGGVNTSPNFDLTQFDIAIVDLPEPDLGPLTVAAGLALVIFCRKSRSASQANKASVVSRLP
jgi:hypothetical protein